VRNLMNESHIRNVIEAALLAAGKPLQLTELVELFDEGSRPQQQDIQAALTALMAEYSNRGIEIKEIATGFRIQVRRELANEISRLWPERPARYSRAYLETLALIAYRQPITRAEIEAVRGVAVNPNILKTVIERNWVRVVGHRDVPGRPELLGTTRDFLDYFGLKSLDELPPLAELKAIGDIKVQFDLPDPGPIPLALEVDGTAVAPEGADAAGAPPAAAVDSASQEGDPAHEAGQAQEATTENTSATDTAAEHTTASATTDVADTSVADASAADADASAHGTNPDTTALDTTLVGGRIAGSSVVSGEITESPAEHEASVADRATADIGVADIAATTADEAGAVVAAGKGVAVDEVRVEEVTVEEVTVEEVTVEAVTSSASDGATDTAPLDGEAAKPAGGRGPVRKKRRGKARASDTALHEAEEFAASVDADLAAGDDDVSDEEELSAAGPDSSELVAGPRDIDD
jgi:segregation and condensation protein B